MQENTDENPISVIGLSDEEGALSKSPKSVIGLSDEKHTLKTGSEALKSYTNHRRFVP